jgi:hypothetical protein
MRAISLMIVVAACAGTRSSARIIDVKPGRTGTLVQIFAADNGDLLSGTVTAENAQAEDMGVAVFVPLGEGVHRVAARDGDDALTAVIPVTSGFTTFVRFVLQVVRYFPDEDLTAQRGDTFEGDDPRLVWSSRAY